MSDALLRVLDVRKRFGKALALDGASFEVQRGELFGLLGPNGAGKTTLLSIISLPRSWRFTANFRPGRICDSSAAYTDWRQRA
jgi:ABC-type branched-subunit amino acid transport system ATPase component